MIEQSRIKHALLVTSHHGNRHLQAQAVQSGVKILPGQLAAEVPIEVLT